jgi:hypothetical protein
MTLNDYILPKYIAGFPSGWIISAQYGHAPHFHIYWSSLLGRFSASFLGFLTTKYHMAAPIPTRTSKKGRLIQQIIISSIGPIFMGSLRGLML